jgi:tRNA pseudouridine38-40 synthase
LYKMVRNVTGCLIEIARGMRKIETIPKLFEAKDRKAIGIAAPARGLFLMRVEYGSSSKGSYPESPQTREKK